MLQIFPPSFSGVFSSSVMNWSMKCACSCRMAFILGVGITHQTTAATW